MMTPDEIIAVVQAHKDGKKIDIRHREYCKWEECKDPRWNFDMFDYRVAPEPRTIWINEYPDGFVNIYHSETCAKECASKLAKTSKFIEVLG